MTQITYEKYYWNGIEYIDDFGCIFPMDDQETKYWQRALAMDPTCVLFITECYPEYVI